MIPKRKTRCVQIGSVKIGGKAPILLQSMTKTDTTDVAGCLRQIRKLAQAGAGLVRIAVPTRADTEAFAKIVSRSPLPLAADIHFSPERAIEAIEAGAVKIRLNPGNIKNKNDIHRIIDCAKRHHIAIRIGVNEASIRDLKHDVKTDRRVSLMLNEMTGYVRLFERRKFEAIVLSAKSADTVRTIEINRLLSKTFDYPIHIGLTHAGLLEDALVPSAVAIGTLLAEGIGDTVRVSIAGDPVQEIETGKQILSSLGLYRGPKPELTVCPTCGRCEVDVVGLAQKVRRLLMKTNKPIRVAVMGCVVNGPGEAKEADLGVAFARNSALVFKNGKIFKKMSQVDSINFLVKELEKIF